MKPETQSETELPLGRAGVPNQGQPSIGQEKLVSVAPGRSVMAIRSGDLLDFLNPDPDKILISDIAHALSNICRFGGHATEFYSVAQHSVLVSMIVPPEFALEALLHDAAEAYIGDIILPIKRTIEQVAELEAGFTRAISSKFSVPLCLSNEVRHADAVALATEKRDLIYEREIADWGLPDPVGVRIYPLTPNQAREEFLSRYEEVANR